jgi:hypothetical protein
MVLARPTREPIFVGGRCITRGTRGDRHHRVTPPAGERSPSPGRTGLSRGWIRCRLICGGREAIRLLGLLPAEPLLSGGVFRLIVEVLMEIPE